MDKGESREFIDKALRNPKQVEKDLNEVRFLLEQIAKDPRFLARLPFINYMLGEAADKESVDALPITLEKCLKNLATIGEVVRTIRERETKRREEQEKSERELTEAELAPILSAYLSFQNLQTLEQIIMILNLFTSIRSDTRARFQLYPEGEEEHPPKAFPKPVIKEYTLEGQHYCISLEGTEILLYEKVGDFWWRVPENYQWVREQNERRDQTNDLVPSKLSPQKRKLLIILAAVIALIGGGSAYLGVTESGRKILDKIMQEINP